MKHRRAYAAPLAKPHTLEGEAPAGVSPLANPIAQVTIRPVTGSHFSSRTPQPIVYAIADSFRPKWARLRLRRLGGMVQDEGEKFVLLVRAEKSAEFTLKVCPLQLLVFQWF